MKSSLTIAIIGPAHPYRGGIAAFTERLANQFKQDGHEVTIYSFSLQYPSFLFPGKTQFTTDPSPDGLRILRTINSINPLSWFKTAREISSGNYDLVIVMQWIPFIAISFATILSALRKRTQSRNLPVEKNSTDTKIISIVHNLTPHEPKPGDRFILKRFIKHIDHFVALSESVKQDILDISPNKDVRVSPHPLYDHYGELVEKKKACSALGLNPDVNYLLFFGLIREYKGLDLLLEAFADSRFRNRNMKLIVAGEHYDDAERYDQLIHSKGLESEVIRLQAFIPDSDVKYYFSAADVLIQPYRTATQSGVTQIAYHFDLPMIVTDVGGLKEMCPDGVVGYVCEPNIASISEALDRFLASDQKQFRENIKNEKNKFSWEIFSSKILEWV